MNRTASFVLTGSALIPALVTSAPAPVRPALRFEINQGETQNWFFKNNRAAVQLVVRSGNPRVVAAFPAGNSGVGLWFEGTADLKLMNPRHSRKLPAAGGDDASEFVSFSITSNQPTLTLRKVLLDSVRILRGAPPEKEVRPARLAYANAHGLAAAGHVWPKEKIRRTQEGTLLSFERADFGSREPYRATLHFPPGTRVEKVKEGWKITSPHGNVSFDAVFSVPYKALTPFNAHELFIPALRNLVGGHKDAAMLQAIRNLDFLAFKEKFVAGGWNYLTYFGRDTAFTLFMLGDILTPQAHEAALQSLLDRVSDKGEIPHEEDLGSLSQAEHLARGEAPSQKPVLNYTMVDENFLLPIAFARYLKKVSPLRARIFLAAKNARGETNRETLLRNYRLVLSEAAPFARTGMATDLIRLKPGRGAGNWRDSTQGLAFGVYPADVNLWLVPAALEGIKETSPLFPEKLSPGSIDLLLERWKNAKKFFEVTLSTDQVKEQVRSYLNSNEFTPSERRYFLSKKIENQTTVGDFLNGKTPPALKNGLSFPALSLDANGKPIPVMHSDEVLGLFLNDPSKEEIEKMLPLFSLPYPIGLRTDVGLLSANPCYTKNKHNLWKELNADAYHGTVVWVWSQSMLRLSLAAAEKRFSGDRRFASKLDQLDEAYRRTDGELGSLALSELYTWEVREAHGSGRMIPVPYGLRAASQNEACAIQLWSSVLPALRLARSRY